MHGHFEEVHRALVVGLGEAVHVPQPAMVRFPCVERIGRLQNRAVALHGFDFTRDRRDDAVADFVEHP